MTFQTSTVGVTDVELWRLHGAAQAIAVPRRQLLQEEHAPELGDVLADGGPAEVGRTGQLADVQQARGLTFSAEARSWTPAETVNRRPSRRTEANNKLSDLNLDVWLGGRDLNPDTVVQSHVSYRWTTSQYTASGRRSGNPNYSHAARRTTRWASAAEPTRLTRVQEWTQRQRQRNHVQVGFQRAKQENASTPRMNNTNQPGISLCIVDPLTASG